MSLVFADEILWTGADCSPRPWDHKLWENDLAFIDLPGLRDLYKSLVVDAGATSFDSLNKTAANNWNSLAQRMRFVAPMFRSRQVGGPVTDGKIRDSLECPPFSAENLAAVGAGQLPKERDLCLATCCEVK